MKSTMIDKANGWSRIKADFGGTNTRNWRSRVYVILLLMGASVLLVHSEANSPAINYSTYLGGPDFDDSATGVAVDAAGNIYISGISESPDFPVTTPVTGTFAWGKSAYVAKFSSDGALLYSTYIPGTCGGVAKAIAVDAQGNAYITGNAGYCWPDSGGLPRGVLVAKLDPNGVPIYVFSFGASFGDSSEGKAIAVDGGGSAYITGNTTAGSEFPVTPGAFQTSPCGGLLTDGFVAKVNPFGNGLEYCSYLCGTSYEAMKAIGVDAEGNAFVAGNTWSHDFPVVNAFQAQHPGDALTDAGFLCKVNPSGTKLEYSTYFAGSFGGCVINAIAVDPAGNAFITGESAGGKLLTTAGVAQPTPPFANCWGALCGDAYVAKFNPAGSLLFSTFLAGEQDDSGKGIALDAEGNIYVTGATRSLYFPVLDAFQLEPRGWTDIFVAKLNRDATRILFSSYLGGGKMNDDESSPDASNRVTGIAVDSEGYICLAGSRSLQAHVVIAERQGQVLLRCLNRPVFADLAGPG